MSLKIWDILAISKIRKALVCIMPLKQHFGQDLASIYGQVNVHYLVI